MVFIIFAFIMSTDYSRQFEQKIKDFIERNRLLSSSHAVLVALSGGADSVALLRVLLALGFECKAAHCNFHLRGDESERDEQFVISLCKELDVPLFVKDFDVPAYMKENGVSLEMACRDLRYAWFKVLLREQDCRELAVAHHQNDNVETFFLNALRGAGINGLSGIASKNGAVVRPLLCASRGEVVDYLDDNGWMFVTDSSNQKNDVKRNKLRNIVLPTIEQHFPGAFDQFCKTIGQVSSCNSLYDEFLQKVKDGICKFDEGVLYIEIEKLLQFVNSTTLLFEILKPYGFNHAQCCDVFRAIDGENGVGKHFYSSSHTLTINRAKLEVFVNKEKLECSYGINLKCNKISYPIEIDIKEVSRTEYSLESCNGKDVIALSLEVLKSKDVLIRRWKNGDKFKPFGINGSKLLSDLFTDLKLSERKKAETWVMEADGQIIWVIGYRASSLFKVKVEDESYLLVSLCK